MQDEVKELAKEKDKLGKLPEQCGLKYQTLPDRKGNNFRGTLMQSPSEPFVRYEWYREVEQFALDKSLEYLPFPLKQYE